LIEPTPNAVVVDAVRPLIGNPVALVKVALDGVPREGFVRVGDVKVLLVKVSVEDTVTTFTPSTAILPADALVIVVSVA
jgi:hypothetical protein